MDPITALSVAAAAGQFLTFAFDLAKGAVERYRSIEGAEQKHIAIAEDAKHINDLLNALPAPNDIFENTDYGSGVRASSAITSKLETIVRECNTVSNELQTLL